ncbi:MAG: AAA family ATPase [Oscillospiraceae bacterium]|nr:AAA family ATPase [Oscillospiraceae bacterium]
MRVLSTTSINSRHEDGCCQNFIADSENRYTRQLESVIETLASEKAEKPIILLSGPSGSGKTTTAFRIRKRLNELGVNTYALSMDNYFIPADDPRTVYEADGSIDFEAPRRLEMEQLSEHLEKMWNQEEFTLPIFDFVNQKQLKGAQFKRQKGEMVILEGIHALNPDVTGQVSEHSSGVYVSIRTRIKSTGGKLLHPSKIRLMRRLIRDSLFRGRETVWTLKYFEDVERGETKYILPYKCYAEHQVDTFMPYELAAYKDFLLKDLQQAKSSYDGFSKYEDLLLILEELDSVELEHVPRDSLLREFVGGSEFKY